LFFPPIYRFLSKRRCRGFLSVYISESGLSVSSSRRKSVILTTTESRGMYQGNQVHQASMDQAFRIPEMPVEISKTIEFEGGSRTVPILDLQVGRHFFFACFTRKNCQRKPRPKSTSPHAQNVKKTPLEACAGLPRSRLVEYNLRGCADTIFWHTVFDGPLGTEDGHKRPSWV
jgi:hypothetical protein